MSRQCKSCVPGPCKKGIKGDARLSSHLTPFPIMATKTAGRKEVGNGGSRQSSAYPCSALLLQSFLRKSEKIKKKLSP